MSRRHPGGPRTVEVDAERVLRWVDGFADRHGEPEWSAGAEPSATESAAREPSEALHLSAPDGAGAVLHRWPRAAYGAADSGPAVPRNRRELVSWVVPPRRIGLFLVRRGGYAVGLADGDRLERHHCGTRYVQSRTAAGGWSQQRFARRRGNQADALVESVAARIAEIVLPAPPPALVVGGDRALVRQVLRDPRLAALEDRPNRELYDLPDPRLTVLQQALRRGRATRVTITEP